jgi:hypothetical protein
MSTYPLIDSDGLCGLIRTKARELRGRGGVHIVVSKGPASKVTTSKLLKRLEGDGVVVHRDHSSHSKCMVVDDEQVLIGSANVKSVFRDLVVHFTSRSLAREVSRLPVGRRRRSLTTDRFACMRCICGSPNRYRGRVYACSEDVRLSISLNTFALKGLSVIRRKNQPQVSEEIEVSEAKCSASRPPTRHA